LYGFIFISFILSKQKKPKKQSTNLSLGHSSSKDKLREQFIRAWPRTDSLIGNALSLTFAKLPARVRKEPRCGLEHVVGFV
jgi:hypothetical protein